MRDSKSLFFFGPILGAKINITMTIDFFRLSQDSMTSNRSLGYLSAFFNSPLNSDPFVSPFIDLLQSTPLTLSNTLLLAYCLITIGHCYHLLSKLSRDRQAYQLIPFTSLPPTSPPTVPRSLLLLSNSNFWLPIWEDNNHSLLRIQH